MVRVARVVLGVALLAAAGVARAQERDLWGLPVESVSFLSDGEVDAQEIASLVTIRVGAPLSEEETGATIRNLFATGNFADVAVQAEPAAGGSVAVTVLLWRAYRVRDIRFVGKVPISREEVQRLLPLQERGLFDGTALENGASALQRRLEADGYLGASVSPEADLDPATLMADVTYTFSAGEPSPAAEAFFDGETAPFAPGELLAKAKLKPGKRYRESAARSDADRMRRFLLREGYLRASVDLIAAEPRDDGRIRPVYRIQVGPRVVFETEGIPEKRVRKEILKLLEQQPFDADTLDFWAETSRTALQRARRYRAEVEAKASETGDPEIVSVRVTPGPKLIVERVEFRGDAAVPEETLRKLLVTRPRGLPLVGSSGYVVDSDIAEDASAVRGYYQTHGWVGVRVARPEVTAGSKPDLLVVTIPIEEGPRAFVASRRLEGAEHVTPEEVERLVPVREGQPLNPAEVRLGTAQLSSWYRDHGWREASVRDSWTLSEDGTVAEVVYRVEEGMRSFFGKTIIRGNARTDPERIARLVDWEEGAPFSEEKVLATQRNLTRTGVFRSVQVSPQPSDPVSQTRNVDVAVREGRPVSLLYGVGYQYLPSATDPNDPFAIAGISHNNLWGSLRRAAFEVQYAPISGRGRIVASFLEPYLFATEYPLSISVFAAREPIQKVDFNRFGTYLESSRQISRYLRAGLRYEYVSNQPVNPEELPDQLSRFDQPILQSAIGPNFLYDRRDDIIDPHGGYYVTGAGKYAFPFLKAEARYGKASGQVAWFHSVFRGVFAAAFRIGAIFPYDLLDPVCLPPSEECAVPIPERFFAGGSSIGRGFGTDVLGIPGVTVSYDTTATLADPAPGSCAELYPDDPVLAEYDCSPGPRIIGGNGFLGINVEYRFPLAGNLGGTVYYDLAQVWREPGDINFQIEGETGLRQSLGGGLRYLTPIGPLRLEYAFPLERRTIPFAITLDGVPIAFDTTKEKGRFLFSIGYAF